MNELNLGIQLWDYKDVRSFVDEFIEIYKRRPIKNNFGGMTSTHLFWTWYVLKKIQPAHVIESGVYKGQGTWIISHACPDAKIYSIDPNLAIRIYVNEKVRYYIKDFNIINWAKEGLDEENTVCFFDDHVNAYLRLQQMKWMGFKKAMFEDNYPVSQGDCYSCKKILAGSGLTVNGEEIIDPNLVHLEYFKKNIKTYTTLLPLFKNEMTRWGDEWDNINYPTPAPIFTNDMNEQYDIIKKEASGYTWICYVELK